MFRGKHIFFNKNGIEADANGIEAKPPTSELQYNLYRSAGPKWILPALDPNDAVIEDRSSGFETWVLVPPPVPTDAAPFHSFPFRGPPRKPRPPRQPRTPRAPRVARELRPSRQPRPSRRPRISRPPRNLPASISPPVHPGIDDPPCGWEDGSTAPARRSDSPSPSFVASETASESDLVPVYDDD